MIVQFGVSNFLVYHNLSTIQFLTNSKESNFSETDSVGNRFYRCLKYVSLFGSNASGKSSFIKAVDYFRKSIIDNGVLSRSSNLYCRTNKENQEEPSSFEIVLENNGQFIQYGFSVLLKNGQIIDEYINVITPSTKASNPVFNRKDKVFNLVLKAKTKKELDYRLEDSIQRNALFLTSVGSMLYSSETPNEELVIFNYLYRYIVDRIVIINKNIQSQYLFTVDKIDNAFVSILQNFDFNIEEIKKNDVDVDTIFSVLPYEQVEAIKKDLNTSKQKSVNLVLRGKYYIFRNVGDSIKCERLYFKHFGSDLDFEYLEESDGTLRIMDFIPIIFMFDDDVTFFIDEIEQSLSSDVVVEFFRMLREQKSPVQILFSTQLDRLFDRKYFRKDEIYIVEKNRQGESSFTRFNQFVSSDSSDNINKKFIDGRYGGRPKIY